MRGAKECLRILEKKITHYLVAGKRRSTLKCATFCGENPFPNSNASFGSIDFLKSS
jgi:hypothetical protein